MDDTIYRRIRLLLEPSWFSGLIAVAIGVTVVLGTFLVVHAHSMGLNSQIFSDSTFGNPTYQAIGKNLSKYPLINYLPLYLFWAGVGAAVYFLASHIFKTINNAASIKKQLNYVNAKSSELFKQTLLSLALRLFALSAWIVTLIISLKIVLPYCLLEIHGVSAHITLRTVYVSFGIVLLLAFDVWLLTIFTRLMCLRARIFGSSSFL